MTLRTWSTLAAAVAAAFTLGACGSSSSPPGPGEVFGDAVMPGINYAPFAGSDDTAHSIDPSEKHAGSASFRIDVPTSGYVGASFNSLAPRNLTGFNAVTFWAKASKAAVLDVAGFGASATPTHIAERPDIALTTTWTKYVIPLPTPSLLTGETAMFHFAEGADATGYTIWFDDIRYETLPAGSLSVPAAAIATEDRAVDVGLTIAANGTIYRNGALLPGLTWTTPAVVLGVSPHYLTWSSSDASVATVDAAGVVTGVAPGTADITARFGTTDAAGKTSVTVSAPVVPTVAAPTPPARAAADVISLFSDAYTDVTVGTWSADWDSANVADVQVAGNATKRYTALVFAGIDFTGSKIDASTMTHLHMDVWTPPGSTGGTKFGVKLVNFGSGGNSEAVVAFHAAGLSPVKPDWIANWSGLDSPVLAAGEWISLEIPVASFAGMTFEALGQMLLLDNADTGLAGDEAGTFFVDNVYFHK